MNSAKWMKTPSIPNIPNAQFAFVSNSNTLPNEVAQAAAGAQSTQRDAALALAAKFAEQAANARSQK